MVAKRLRPVLGVAMDILGKSPAGGFARYDMGTFEAGF
jgi:hypothetical protein